MDDSTLHEAIVASFLRLQRPPTVREIATRFKCSEAEARQGLRGLADRHGVKKWSTREAADIFERHNLSGPTWALAGHSERF